MRKIEIEIPDGKRAEWVNGVLTLVAEQPQDITERIMTLEDACKWCSLNRKYHLVVEFERVAARDCSPDLLAYVKLRIITAALNEGWEWEPCEQGGYGIMSMDDDSFRTYFHCSSVDMLVGKGLLLKTDKLAVYAAKQFADIYADFCGCKKGGQE